ncbi:heat-inducible transcriptional repressor HrcA [Acidobacteria bacterium AH-259-D05]|nr:heat-inducible transcriptional repressor HrcA [Acidobacteria bacterium AH-259-D05]
MVRQRRSAKSDERSRDVLKAVIREYVRSGKPVGSRRLAKSYREGLSPSTIRTVMAELEEMGLVTQPHTSAGRVPTAKGYRFYVDSLLNMRKLPVRQAVQIKESLEPETDPGELMNKTSQVLSTLSNNVGFVLAPPLSAAIMKHIKFIRISRQRILVILVTGSGLVKHRIIQLDQNFAQSELDQAGRYLVAHFEGNTLVEIRVELLSRMLEEKSLYDRLLMNAVVLGTAGLVKHEGEENEESEVYLGGTARIIQKPELADINRMITLFQTFEEKSRLVKIINECLKTNPSGPSVQIGLGKDIPEMRDWALVSSPYLYNQKAIGGLGILGPSRMEYEKAISLVDYVAKLFSQLMSSN